MSTSDIVLFWRCIACHVLLDHLLSLSFFSSYCTTLFAFSLHGDRPFFLIAGFCVVLLRCCCYSLAIFFVLQLTRFFFFPLFWHRNPTRHWSCCARTLAKCATRTALSSASSANSQSSVCLCECVSETCLWRVERNLLSPNAIRLLFYFTLFLSLTHRVLCIHKIKNIVIIRETERLLNLSK